MRNKKKKIYNYLVVLISVTFILVAGIYITATSILRQYLLRNSEKSSIVLANTISDHFDFFIENALKGLKNISTLFFDSNNILNKSRYNLYIGKTLKTYNIFYSIKIININGKIKYLAPYKENLSNFDVSHTKIFKQTLKNKIYFSDTYLNLSNGQPTISLSILNKKHIIQAELNFNSIKEYVEDINLEYPNFITIIDDKRTFILHPDMKKVVQRETDNVYINQNFNNNDNILTYYSKYKNNEMFTVAFKVKKINWTIQVHLAIKNIYSSILILDKFFIPTIIIVFALSLAFIISITKKMAKYFNKLIDMTIEASVGNYKLENYSYPYNEFDVLSNNFISMLAEIENRESEIKDKNIELQNNNFELVETKNELYATNKLLGKALNEAEEANKLKSQFLAMMSHELRTPLNGIIGFAELFLKSNSVNSSNINDFEFIEYIFESSIRLNEILTNLLELTVIQAGRKIKVNLEKFDIRKMINDIVYLYKSKLKKSNNSINIEILSEDIVYSDKLKIQQIFLNLIGNAIKFTSNGEIKIRVISEPEYYIFEVSDTGIGIEKENLNKIFDIFKQIHSSWENREYQGVGLGLTICKKFTEALNGRIWVESAIDKGSKFFIKVPNNIERKSLNAKSNFKNEKYINNEIKVLFAEDDILNKELLKQSLGSLPYIAVVKGFNNGKELIDYLKNSDIKYDLIILDIQMPIVNGLDSLLEIRKIDMDIPVIALTAYNMKSDKKKFLDLGFSEYIGKPINLEKLDNTLRKTLIKTTK